MLKFKANYNTIIFGQTGDGKTQFMLNVIRRKNITPFPENIFYMYNVEQDFIKTWNQSEESKIKFIYGLDFEQLDTTKPSLLVIDDLLLSTNKKLAEMFILGCTVDYVKEFGGSYLKVVNPNATAQCGCGESFAV